MGLEPGLKGEATVVVDEARTAVMVASGALPVYATPMMIALMEQAAFEAVQPHLPHGESTVGAGLAIRHLAATPVGLHVRAVARLDEVDGRRLRFTVEAFDEREQIGEGSHERVVVDTGRFMERAAAKRR